MEIVGSRRSSCCNDAPLPFQVGCLHSKWIAPACGPRLWEAADAEHDPAADPLLPPIPAFEFDQRLSW